MPVWTTVYLSGDERQRVLRLAGAQGLGSGSWSGEDRQTVHAYIIHRIRARLVEALRQYCKEPDEAEEQLLLTVVFAACNRGPTSMLNSALYDVPQRAALSELRVCLGEAGYDEAIGYIGRDGIFEQILGAILQNDCNLQRFMSKRFPEPLV